MAMTEEDELYFVGWLLFLVKVIFWSLASLLGVMLVLGLVFSLSDSLNRKATQAETRIRRYFSGKTE